MASAVATCITGEPRTFAMPFVHLRLLRTVREWKSDTYFVFPARTAAANVTPFGYAVTHCQHSQAAIDLFKPAGVQLWRPSNLGESRSAAWAQLGQWSACHAMAARRRPRYGILARLRPDFAVMAPAPLPLLADLRAARPGSLSPR